MALQQTIRVAEPWTTLSTAVGVGLLLIVIVVAWVIIRVGPRG